MRVLVTGNLGYIGTRLVPLLRSAQIDVVGYDNGLFEGCSISPVESVPTIAKDIRDVECSDVRNFDAVIHLAGLSNDPLGNIHPEMTLKVNYEGTIRFAEVAKQAGVQRFLYASSCSIYGAAGDQVLDEESKVCPLTPYAVSKVMSEVELRRLASGNFSPVFLRAATAYGVSPMIRFDLVLNNLVAWAVTTGVVHIKSDGTPWRPVVHVEDIAAAYLAALRAPAGSVHLEAFNVGRSLENYRVRELAELVRDRVPGTLIEYAANGRPDKRCYRVNCSKISKHLKSFKPRWTTAKGVVEIHEAMAALGLRNENFEGVGFNRVEHLMGLKQVGKVDDELRLLPMPASVFSEHFDRTAISA